MSLKVLLVAVVVALLSAVGFLGLRSYTSPPARDLGLRDGHLAGCPASPNCVSSEAQDDAHRVGPLPLHGSPEEAMTALRAAIEAMPRTRVVTAADGYLHAEFTSALFRYVDDLQLHVDPDADRIEVRSASRTGYWDVGANRKRVEALRTAYAERTGAGAP